jgi:hypothetical protein
MRIYPVSEWESHSEARETTRYSMRLADYSAELNEFIGRAIQLSFMGKYVGDNCPRIDRWGGLSGESVVGV